MFFIQAPEQVRYHRQRVTEMLQKQLPKAVPVMDPARDDVLDHSNGEEFVYLNFPQGHWRKIWSTTRLSGQTSHHEVRSNAQ